MAKHKIYSRFQLQVSDISVEVTRKNVKNLNLRVYPGEGLVKLSAPKNAPDRVIENFIQAKLPWIKDHFSRFKRKPGKPKKDYQNGELHPIWGKEYELKVFLKKAAPTVSLHENELILQVRPGSTKAKKASVLREWYRAELKREIPKLIKKWEPVMGVSVNEFGVKRMKTRWGTCNIRDKRIWLNLELAKKRPELLEYVVVHEMTHLHERLHNKRFYGLMTRFLPNWKPLQDELNGRTGMRAC